MRTATPRPMRAHDGGFSLVELLVVIAILGILAAVAVPLLIGQRERAGDVTLKSDLRLVAGAVEAIRADGDPLTESRLREGLRLSPGTVVGVYETSTDYCLEGVRDSGSPASQPWIYSSTGGLGDSSDTTCTGTHAFDLP